jgi:phosphatidylglycerophosphate synthase
MVGALLILVAYLFDCMDGEVARARKVSSSFGSQLDQVSNWITLVALQIGLALGASASTGNSKMLVWGMFAVAGWCTFYYLYIQLVSWIPADGDYRLLRRLSKILFVLMPLDENLVILFALLGRPDVGIMVSASIGMTLSGLVCGIYIAYRIHYET